MTRRLRATAAGCAIYTPSGADGNDPFSSPAANIDKVFFHSDFDYYGLIASGTTTISHSSVAGVTGTQLAPPSIVSGINNMDVVVNGQIVAADHTLYTHGLGYVPKCFVAYAGQMLPTGFPVQQDDSSRVRFVCAYATTSIIGLREIGYSSASALSAVSRDYQYLVFRDPSTGLSGDQLLIEAGNVWFGRGKFRSAEAHLRVAGAGDTPFGIALGPTAGYGNGGLRTKTPGGSTIDYGSYSGSFAAPTIINVGV